MKKTEDKPYLDAPVQKETTKEQMIYGGGETLTEKEKKRKEQQDKMLNEARFNEARFNETKLG